MKKIAVTLLIAMITLISLSGCTTTVVERKHGHKTKVVKKSSHGQTKKVIIVKEKKH